MSTQPIFQAIARKTEALKNCIKSGNSTWEEKHGEALDVIEGLLPKGSGIDAGTTIDRNKTTANKIVLTTSYHHMDENGYYDGWTDHEVIITPSFDGIKIRITGKDRNNIKDYLRDLFHESLSQHVTI